MYSYFATYGICWSLRIFDNKMALQVDNFKTQNLMNSSLIVCLPLIFYVIFDSRKGQQMDCF